MQDIQTQQQLSSSNAKFNAEVKKKKILSLVQLKKKRQRWM